MIIVDDTAQQLTTHDFSSLGRFWLGIWGILVKALVRSAVVVIVDEFLEHPA